MSFYYESYWVILYSLLANMAYDPVIFPVTGPSVLSAANKNAWVGQLTPVWLYCILWQWTCYWLCRTLNY